MTQFQLHNLLTFANKAFFFFHLLFLWRSESLINLKRFGHTNWFFSCSFLAPHRKVEIHISFLTVIFYYFFYPQFEPNGRSENILSERNLAGFTPFRVAGEKKHVLVPLTSRFLCRNDCPVKKDSCQKRHSLNFISTLPPCPPVAQNDKYPLSQAIFYFVLCPHNVNTSSHSTPLYEKSCTALSIQCCSRSRSPRRWSVYHSAAPGNRTWIHWMSDEQQFILCSCRSDVHFPWVLQENEREEGGYRQEAESAVSLSKQHRLRYHSARHLSSFKVLE